MTGIEKKYSDPITETQGREVQCPKLQGEGQWGPPLIHPSWCLASLFQCCQSSLSCSLESSLLPQKTIFALLLPRPGQLGRDLLSYTARQESTKPLLDSLIIFNSGSPCRSRNRKTNRAFVPGSLWTQITACPCLELDLRDFTEMARKTIIPLALEWVAFVCNKAKLGSLTCQESRCPQWQQCRAMGWVVISPHTPCPHKLGKRLGCSDAGGSATCCMWKGALVPWCPSTALAPIISGCGGRQVTAWVLEERGVFLVFTSRVVPFLKEPRAEVQRVWSEKERELGQKWEYRVWKMVTLGALGVWVDPVVPWLIHSSTELKQSVQNSRQWHLTKEEHPSHSYPLCSLGIG